MAIGNAVVGSIITLAQNSILDIKPTGEEWTIHNIQFEIPTNGSIEILKTDGTNILSFDSDTSNGGRWNMTLHCTSLVWYQLKNISATAISIIVSYDGVVTG